MTERIKSKLNCLTEQPIVQKFIMPLRSKILDSLTKTSRGLSSRQLILDSTNGLNSQQLYS